MAARRAPGGSLLFRDSGQMASSGGFRRKGFCSALGNTWRVPRVDPEGLSGWLRRACGVAFGLTFGTRGMFRRRFEGGFRRGGFRAGCRDTWHSPKDGPEGGFDGGFEGLSAGLRVGSERCLGRASGTRVIFRKGSERVSRAGLSRKGFRRKFRRVVFRNDSHRWIRDQRLGFLCEIGPRRGKIGLADRTSGS